MRTVKTTQIGLDEASRTRLEELSKALDRSASAVVRALIMAAELPRQTGPSPAANWEGQVKGSRRGSGRPKSREA